MIAFAPSLFPDAVHLQPKVRPTPVGVHGGENPTWTTPGTQLGAYVELIVQTVLRPDRDQARPKSVRRYRVFTAADSGARIDDHLGWQGRTLVVREPSVIQGPLWVFECEDVE